MTAFDAHPRNALPRRLLGVVSTLLFVAALAACDASTPATASPADGGAKTPDGAQASVACPSQQLGAFVAAFAEDPALQNAFTAPMVDTAFVDMNAQPEPAESVEALPRERLHFPVMPNRAQQQKEGLQYREISNEGGRAVVALEVPDTDAQLLYTFRRDACWTLVKIVDPAFGKAFPGEAPKPAAQGEANAEAIVRDAMRAQYGDAYDAERDCWPTTYDDGENSFDYCMRPAKATTVETPVGKQLLFLAHNIQDFDAKTRRYSYSRLDPGLIGLFALSLDAKGGWTVRAATKAEPFGMEGDCGCGDAQPTRLGRDDYGWILTSGGVWQGVVVSDFSVYAPIQGKFAPVGTFADIAEDEQAVSHRVTVDASNPDAPHYPLIVATLRDKREVGRETVAFDAKRMRYPAAKDR
ncbi:MAG: hypothetical protein KA144_05915 [Xanthomonadaceae bacterium]|nr:hypothetical protein [Xanthomonadaceae bacterium]